MKREDLDVIAGDTVDFFGVNYYFPHHASANATETIFGLNTSGNKDEDCSFSIKGLFKFVKNPKGKYTDWAWEIFPDGLYDLARARSPVSSRHAGVRDRERHRRAGNSER